MLLCLPAVISHCPPTELKALSSLGDKKAGISKLELRKICKEFATEHIDVMNSQFARLGVQGDFANPYLTLRPEFEARQVEIFGEMAKKGYIYKGMKAVYWCPEDRTALAEAEIERTGRAILSMSHKAHHYLTSVFWPNAKRLPLDKAWIVIWTTTTWTLPANVATCLNPSLEYAFVKIGDEYHLMAAGLSGTTARSPYRGRRGSGARVLGLNLSLMVSALCPGPQGLVILAHHVTLEGGTGCVHTRTLHTVLRIPKSASHEHRRFPLLSPRTMAVT